MTLFNQGGQQTSPVKSQIVYECVVLFSNKTLFIIIGNGGL